MSEITKQQSQIVTRKSQIFWLIFAALVIISYLTGLTIPLLGPDEPRYAQVAREMFNRGDWVTPTLGGFDWFEKPALLYWLQIASYKLFGVSEFAARFGSALFGLGTIFGLWLLGRSLATENTEKHREIKTKNEFPVNSVRSVAEKDFANWLALVAASSFSLIAFSRGASFDIILTFPITAALVSFFLFDTAEKKSGFTFYFLLFTFYFFIGVALLAKGLIGIVFPLAIVAFYYLLSRKMPSRTFVFSLFWGTLLSLLVACAWYLPMYQANGWKFVDEFFIQHHFQRYTSNKYQHPQPFYFFFWVLPLMTLPWLPFFLAAIWNSVKSLFSRKDAKTQSKNLLFSSSPLLLFSLSWLLVPLVFFSASGSKLPGYILPAVPGALILTATAVFRFVQKSRARGVVVKTIAVLTLVGAVILAQFFVTDLLHEETVKHLITTANSRGYANEKIFNLFKMSHSAEFYAAGRLIREADGKQKRLWGDTEILDEMRRENINRVLVFVPLDYVNQLKQNDSFETEILDDNGELAIAVVKAK